MAHAEAPAAVAPAQRGLERGGGERARGRAALEAGRFAEAVQAFARARRQPIEGDPALLALEEAEAFAGLARHGEALRVATRALQRRPTAGDRRARLRIARGLALWEMGRASLARNEIRRAGEEATEALTMARVEEALARLASRDGECELAREHLARARATYESVGYADGVVRTLETEGAILRDVGALEEALATQTLRVNLATQGVRGDALARARADRGALLLALGRWREAREELDLCAGLFRKNGDPRELTLAGVTRAVADLATGDLAAARRALERALDFEERQGAAVRALAEDLLLLADVYLAAGQPKEAGVACRRAQGIFVLARDRAGECWARVRHSQSLLAEGDPRGALREVRRAQAVVPSARVHLRAWASLAMGRILLRTARDEAARAFEQARLLGADRPAMAALADLGRLVARGAAPDDAELRDAIDRLEAWGDRRLLSLSLGDVREFVGVVPAGNACQPLVEDAREVDGSGRALVDAAEALAGGGGWVGAAEALRRWLPWRRIVILGAEAWELREGEASPRRLARGDLAGDLLPLVQPPVFVNLLDDSSWRRHPTRVLHDLAAAVFVRLSGDEVLYADFQSPAISRVQLPQALATLGLFCRLIVAHGAAPRPEAAPPSSFPGLIGESAAMRDLFARMRKVAPWDVPVHIVGETGTGKELVARALHEASPRAGLPFIPLNASCLSDELCDAQLFGHVRGAYTGAVNSGPGLVDAAQGGTLFIDEVADLSTRVQAKLLRFAQDGEYLRVGDTAPRRAGVRILTATNVSLAGRVAKEGFRRDLMYRICDCELHLPPLRERGDDVLCLAQHFVHSFAAQHGKPSPRIPGDVARALQRYAWPGNVRQLQSEMRRLVVFSGEGPLCRTQLREEIQRSEASGGEVIPLREARLDFEREHIARALTRNRGHRSRTAGALGLTRQGLLAKMQQHGLG